jgi:hypothetical protein
MAKVYGYNVTGGSPLFASEALWDRQMTIEGAKRYLEDHLLTQLTRDVPPAIDAFIKVYKESKVGVGFWAVPRMVFPTVTFLGCLYKGDESTAHAIEFLEDYAGRKFEPKYLDLGAAVYIMYRHGLTHTGMPKVIERDDGALVGWKITLDEQSRHLAVDKSGSVMKIEISGERLTQDVCRALENYIADFDGPNRAQLFNHFKTGYLTMAKANRIDDIPMLSTGLRAKLKAQLNAL